MFLSSGKRGNSTSTWSNDWLLNLARERTGPTPTPAEPAVKVPSHSSSSSGSESEPDDEEEDEDEQDRDGSDWHSFDGNSDGGDPDNSSRDGRTSSSSDSSDGDAQNGPWGAGNHLGLGLKSKQGAPSARNTGASKKSTSKIKNSTSSTRDRKNGTSSTAFKDPELELRLVFDELDDTKKMVDLLSSINAELEHQADLLKIQIDDITRSKDAEIESLREQLDQAHFKLRKAERRNRYVDDADRWKADAKYRKKKKDTTQMLFGFPSYEADEHREEILKERRGAQGLVAKSVTVVTSMMHRFNEDLFQMAASCSDKVENMGFERASMSSSSRERADRVLGTRLVSMVLPSIPKTGTPEMGLNPLVLQVVIQTFLVYWCNSIIEAWYPKQPTFAEFLVDVASKLKVGNNANICGKKTLITQKHTPESTNLFNEWVDDIVEDLNEILSIFGWRIEDSSGASIFAPRSSSIHEPLLALVKAAYDIRIAMAEISTSGDVDLVLISCDTPFNALWMEDSYDDSRVAKGQMDKSNPFGKTAIEIVVGTTGIGLQREVFRPHAETGQVIRDIETVLKPRVVLEYTVLEALL